MKSVLSIVAFTLTLSFSVVLVGLLFGFPQANYDYNAYSRATCADQDCRNIEKLIYQDISNGQLRNRDTRGLNLSNDGYLPIEEYTEFVNEYVDKSQSMDDSELPLNFKKAWRKHMKAWQNYSNFLNKQQNSSNKLNDSEFNEFEKEFNSEINRTWHRTLQIGRSYGANVY